MAASSARRRRLVPDELQAQQYRFSGHETFACRFAWIPKAHRFLTQRPDAWSDDEAAMVELGIGKNMVRSLRFWATAMGVVSGRAGKDLAVTPFGERIFGEKGYDPYIEHVATPWLLHWKLASTAAPPLFAWHFMFNRWPYPEFGRSDVLSAFANEAQRVGVDHSDVTLTQHFDVFLHSYLPGRSNVDPEDSLDGPLTDLGLLQIVGDKKSGSGRREPVYAFRRGRKPEISQALFDFVVDDYWTVYRPKESTLTTRELCVGENGPGRILLMSEEEVHARLEAGSSIGSAYEYLPSAIEGRVVRKPHRGGLLRFVYGRAS
jgi:hypothetical protein